MAGVVHVREGQTGGCIGKRGCRVAMISCAGGLDVGKVCGGHAPLLAIGAEVVRGVERAKYASSQMSNVSLNPMNTNV